MDREDKVNELLHQLHGAPDEEAYVICKRLLHLTLADGLTAIAWDVLEVIADDDRLWKWDELPKLLSQYRLPTTREALRRASIERNSTGVADPDSV